MEEHGKYFESMRGLQNDSSYDCNYNVRDFNLWNSRRDNILLGMEVSKIRTFI